MTTLSVSASAVIDAPPARVYGVFIDYRGGHAKILPPFFKSVTIVKGGMGEGTEFIATAGTFGAMRTLRMTAAEPEPGRVLTESDLESGYVTAFTVDPADGGRSNVTIATIWPKSPGLRGWLEAKFAPRMLKGVYEEELRLLAAYLKT